MGMGIPRHYQQGLLRFKNSKRYILRPVSDLMNKFQDLEKQIADLAKDHLIDMMVKAKEGLSQVAAAKCQDGGQGYIKSILTGIPVKTGKHVKARLIISHPAAQYIEYGTGIYATKGSKQKIKAKNVKALAFVVKGQQVVVKSEKGQQPKFIFRDASARFKGTWLAGGLAFNQRLKRFLNG